MPSKSRSKSPSAKKRKADPTLLTKLTLPVEKANLIGALYVGGFGICLAASASQCFGKDGLVPYFKNDTLSGDTAAAWFARSFGTQLLAIASAYYFEPKSILTTKILAV